MSTMKEKEKGHPTIFLVLLGSTVTGLVILFGLITYMRWVDGNEIQADVCAEVLHTHENENITHLRINVTGHSFLVQCARSQPSRAFTLIVHSFPPKLRCPSRLLFSVFGWFLLL